MKWKLEKKIEFNACSIDNHEKQGNTFENLEIYQILSPMQWLQSGKMSASNNHEGGARSIPWQKRESPRFKREQIYLSKTSRVVTMLLNFLFFYISND